MRHWALKAGLLVVLCFSALLASAQEKEAIGKEAADSYLKKRKANPEAAESRTSPRSSQGAPHYLQLHIGSSVNDNSNNWDGPDGREEDVEVDWNIGVTYRLGEWVNSSDFMLRLEYTTFDVGSESPRKISLVPMLFFPDASSRFPLYFGIGAGIGAFTSQTEDESDITLDYQAVAGVRLYELVGSAGVFVEVASKNHLHLVSSGQYNGVMVSFGTIFTF